MTFLVVVYVRLLYLAFGCDDDDMMDNGHHRRRIRRYSLIALSFWPIFAFIFFRHSAGSFPRRRLAQLLRGASDVNDSFKQAKDSVIASPHNETTTAVTIPLHATTGTHHAFMYIGSPPQRQTLIVDTGSRLLAFPCHPCHGCGRHASKFYSHDISTTAVIPKCGSCYLNVSMCSDFSNHCVVTQKYTEGSSWTAFETEDVVWFGTSHVESSVEDLMELAVPHTFGCQTSEKGLFRKQYADGILGLAMHETSIVQAMHQAGAIPRNAFSLCFTRTGGHLSLGGSDTSCHLEPMNFSNISQAHGWYSLQVEQVTVGNISIVNSRTLQSFASGKGTILDSGTTDTFFPKAVAPELANVWKDWSGLDYSNEPRFYSANEFERLPNVKITFEGNVTLTIEPESYMEGVPVSTEESNARPWWRGKHQLTNRLYADEPRGAVLGANAMFGYDILFDTQGHRVGLARADCSAIVTSDESATAK